MVPLMKLQRWKKSTKQNCRFGNFLFFLVRGGLVFELFIFIFFHVCEGRTEIVAIRKIVLKEARENGREKYYSEANS